MLLAGLLLGIAARLFDIYFQNLGEIFSQMAIWILLGTGIAIYSPTKKAAMGNIFPFCMGMLAAYYVTAAITHGVYSRTFIIGYSSAIKSAILSCECEWFNTPTVTAWYYINMRKYSGYFVTLTILGMTCNVINILCCESHFFRSLENEF